MNRRKFRRYGATRNTHAGLGALSRRQMLKLGALGAGTSLLLPDRGLRMARAMAKEPESPFTVVPFQVEMPVPAIVQPIAPGLTPAPGSPDASLGSQAVFHGIAPEFDVDHPDHDADWTDPTNATHHELVIEQRIQEIIPGVPTPVFTYRDANLPEGAGGAPGSTILAEFNQPIVVRYRNELLADKTFVEHEIECSAHVHGGHNPAHSDGFPNFYILPGEARDYYYPNVVPKRVIDDELQFDFSAMPSTLWYHDHAMDITGFNVCHGLAAFYLMVDDREKQLIADGVLPDLYRGGDPREALDIPIALTDQQFNADGTLRYDFLDHNGRIGDVFTANGVAQPFFRVKRRKYRFRILNASNARVYQLRLSTKQSFLHIGNDSWLLPEAHALDDPERGFRLGPAERADLIVDFKGAPDEVYLENIMFQPDGRGPKGVDPDKERTPLIKFVVEGPDVIDDVTVVDGTALREHVPIREEDIVKTRHFRFERSNGAWMINGRFFNPRRSDADPDLDPLGTKAERWILENKSGGWWHPIHLHLEHHEIQKMNGRTPPFHRRFKSDTSLLSGNGVSETFMRFRTFTGPFVFHCHNLEHEDMRMMSFFDPRPEGEGNRFNGIDPIPAEITGVPLTCEELEPDLYSEQAADIDRIEGDGVGRPCDDFEPGS